MPHRSWYKPIYFVIRKHMMEVDDCASYVTYGMGNWCNRCVWIIPGTMQED